MRLRRIVPMRSGLLRGLALVSAGLMSATLWGDRAVAQGTERVVDLTTRGQPLRILVTMPNGPPKGSIVLLAGGHGRLDLSPTGQIGWGAGNQLVRTRADYARAGFVAVVPDIAADFKLPGGGVKPGYRWSSELATDIGAVIRHARTLAGPVHLVATSRAALTAAKAGVNLRSGAERPDTIVITAGMLAAVDGSQPSVQKNVPGLGAITQPVYLLHHAKDGCAHTPVSVVAKMKPAFTGAKRVDVKIIDGGDAGSGNPCEARSHHGFLGQDADVVSLVASWVAAQGR